MLSVILQPGEIHRSLCSSFSLTPGQKIIMPTTIKQALKKWEEATGKKGSDATEVKLIGVYPPIEKVLWILLMLLWIIC